jgi:chromatin structure-remodeling complex subunit RSC9
MKAMFVGKLDGEMTQVEFWKLYKDTFQPFAERFPLLVASDVIKNVNVVFPQAQAMVLPGPPQKFVVRGVQRRKVPTADERFKCHWDRSQCPAETFDSPMALCAHLQKHIDDEEGSHLHCLWMSCPKHTSKHLLRTHVLTHLHVSQPPAKPPSQSDTITLPSKEYPYPTSNPTHRPPPPPRSTTVTYQRPAVDPPSSSLAALLCIRILFRTSFASTDVAPRADADHFGFPGLLDDADDSEPDDAGVGMSSIEREGEQRGRKAFVVVRSLMETVRMRDEVLMGWITEMVEAGFSGRS